MKQESIAQALFSATRPRSIMPLQFALAVATDSRIGSKWMNNLLFKLGFITVLAMTRYKLNSFHTI